jgi:SAM-dependent methyltransferase
VDHHDHVELLRDGVIGAGATWADLGSGTGAFTLALAELLGPGGTIVSVDRDAGALLDQARAMADRYPEVTLHQQVADFTGELRLPPLDGVVMANSLHFVRDKLPVLRAIRERIRDGGRFVLVEYDADAGNRWVPHPVSAQRWLSLASQAGLSDTRIIGRVPSRFLDSIYAAVSRRSSPRPPSRAAVDASQAGVVTPEPPDRAGQDPSEGQSASGAGPLTAERWARGGSPVVAPA